MKRESPHAVQKDSGELNQRSADERLKNVELREISTALLSRLGENWTSHSSIALRRQSLSRILHYDNLYRKIVDIPGVICEFGVHFGATLAQLINLRGIYEPYNASRTIFGFDTFEGFVTIDDKDGNYANIGDYSTFENYKEILDKLLSIHESFSPISHIKKFELIKGDASRTVDTWLENNPHAIISMAIFDMDVYKPTRDVLEKIIPRLTRGSLLVFDEINCHHFPGETTALNEVIGLGNLELRRSPHQPYAAWATFDGGHHKSSNS